MLASAGKFSGIGEMLTIRFAASEPPGERHVNDFASFSVCVHFAGTVHDIPWRSHFACWPPASAAVCAAVGSPCSTFPPLEPEFELEPDEPVELDLLPWSRSERLQRDNEKKMATISVMGFIGHRFVFENAGQVNH